MEDRVAAAWAAGATFAIGLVVVAWNLARGQLVWWGPVLSLAVFPGLIYWRVRTGRASAWARRRRWQAMDPIRRTTFIVLIVAAVVVFNTVGIIAPVAFFAQQVDDDCSEAPGPGGRSRMHLAGPEETLDPTGLLLPSAGDQEAASPSAAVPAPAIVTAQGHWRADVARLSLSMFDGQWYHEGTVHEPAAGARHDFQVVGTYEALRWEVWLVEPAAQDEVVDVVWSTQVLECH